MVLVSIESKAGGLYTYTVDIKVRTNSNTTDTVDSIFVPG